MDHCPDVWPRPVALGAQIPGYTHSITPCMPPAHSGRRNCSLRPALPILQSGRERTLAQCCANHAWRLVRTKFTKQWAVDYFHGQSTWSARSRQDLHSLGLFFIFFPLTSHHSQSPRFNLPSPHPINPPHPSLRSHPLRSPLSIMSRVSDYDDHIVRATSYETLFDYRSTVRSIPALVLSTRSS